MMQLPCPFCGLRDYTEFTYGGDASIRRPVVPEALDDAAWAAYMYLRANTRGAHRELWQHSGGCRRWIVVCRDTATHEVLEDGALPASLAE